MVYNDSANPSNSFVHQVNAAYRGEEDVPVVDTDEYTLWLVNANRKIHEWARDAKQTWASCFETRELGTVSAGTQEYDIDENFIGPANYVYVLTTDNNKRYYNLARPQQAQDNNFDVYISGRDPQTLTFWDTITTATDIVGGTINLNGYWIPDALANASDVIPVDDPYWLVYAVASELAFSDVTYEDKYVDLNTKANNLYTLMSNANRRGTSNHPRKVLTNVPRIRSSSRS